MKIHLVKALFINRAPFDKRELDFSENEISVLTAVNGGGKTTILSYIVDAFHEMARVYFPNEFEGKQNKYYRVSSPFYNLIQNQPSFVYLRFTIGEEFIDYLDIRGNCTEEQYNKIITIDDKILFSNFSGLINDQHVKKLSSNFNKEKANIIFSKNILTFFPSYRFEKPGYLNDPYKINIDFKKYSDFTGYLKNRIEVREGLPQLANWIMDVVLDMYQNENALVQENLLIKNLNIIISNTIIAKNYGKILGLGIGARDFGSTRIQIKENIGGQTIYPSIFNLSSGESSMLCIFGELLRQADNIKNNIALDQITGIVLIDEVDKYLHIKLQKEVLPILFNLFPNVQFILTSHSPFLNMGLAEKSTKIFQIIDLDSFGISKDPTTPEIYTEVYEMMIKENKRFRELYKLLQQEIKEGNKPLIITEGKTDIQHIKKAKEKLRLNDFDIRYFSADSDSNLKAMLEVLSKIPHSRKIIGIFDRDVKNIVDDIEKDGKEFKIYNNNVYAFCIPVPLDRENYTNISIEFYYNDKEIKKEKNEKRLYFDNEVDYLQNKSLNKPEIRKLDSPRLEKENSKKIFEEKDMCKVANWIHSKAHFADLIETDDEFISDFNFSNFSLIFDRIKLIINTSL